MIDSKVSQLMLQPMSTGEVLPPSNDEKTMDESYKAARFTDSRYFAQSSLLEYLFIFTAMLSQLLALSATTCVMPILQILQHDFGVNRDTSTWYLASIGLGLGTLILPSGSIGDKYGLKVTILAGYAWTFVWSLLCGFSYYVNSNFFICCRTFQGCGLAVAVPNVIGVVGRIYRPDTLRKNMVLALVGYAAPLGAWFGTIFTGIIGTETPRWDWAFYAYAIFCFIALIFSWVSIPYIEPSSKRGMDWIGSAIGVAALTLFNFAWNQAPIAGWSNPYIIILLIVGLILVPSFVVYEIRFAKHPLLEPAVLENANLMLTLACIFLGWGSYGIKLFQFFKLVMIFRGYTPVAAGASNTSIVVAGGIASMSCAIIMKKKSSGRHVLLFSMLSFLASDLILATCPVDEAYWRSTFGFWIIATFGMDWSFPGATIILSDTLPSQLQGLSGSLVSTALNYGISIFLGIAGTVTHQLSLQTDHSNSELRAWRGTMYFSIGVSSLSCLTAFLLWILLYWSEIKKRS